MTYFDGGQALQVFNSLWYPTFDRPDAPLLGVDLLRFGPKKFLCIVDAQPPQGRARAAHDTSTLDAIKRKYPALEGEVSSRYYDDNRFFSKQMLYGRFGDDGEKLVEARCSRPSGPTSRPMWTSSRAAALLERTRGPSRRTTTRSTPSATRRTGSSRRTSARAVRRVPLGVPLRAVARERGRRRRRARVCVRHVAATAWVALSIRALSRPGMLAGRQFAASNNRLRGADAVAWTRGHRSPLRPASTPPGIQRLPRRSERAARCVHKRVQPYGAPAAALPQADAGQDLPHPKRGRDRGHGQEQPDLGRGAAGEPARRPRGLEARRRRHRAAAAAAAATSRA